jgi:hypothetical protein
LPLASGTTQSVVLTQNTTAFVQIEKGFCSTQSACINFDPTIVGVEKFNSEQLFSIYPNPATHLVNISLPSVATQVTIADMLGKVVFIQKDATGQLTISTETFTNGFYLVQAESNGKIMTKKLVINN